VAEFQIIDTKLWASEMPEDSYNDSPTAGADYVPLVSLNPLLMLPKVGKFTDAGRIGTGTEFATHQCNDYWSHPAAGLSTDLELFEIYGRLWLRGFGGAVSDTPSGTTGIRHGSFLQLRSEGRQLPSTAIIVDNGPNQVLLSGMVVDSMQLVKERTGRPTLSVNLLGSGKHEYPHTVTSLPDYSAPSTCPIVADLIVSYTKADSTVVNLAEDAGCRFRAFSVAVGNNLKTDDRCPGDTLLTMNGAEAPYVRRLLRQIRQVGIQFTFVADDNIIEYAQYLKNDIITDVEVAVQGAVIGAGPARFTIGIRFEKAVFELVDAIDSEGDMAYTASILPLYDSTTTTAAEGYVINDTATDFE